VRTLGEMQDSMNTLIEHKNVLSIAAQVISGALDAGAEVAEGDEEKKSGGSLNAGFEWKECLCSIYQQ